MADEITFRDATTGDVPFLAQIMHMAACGHLQRGMWEWLFDLTPEEDLAFLSAMAVTDEPQMCHHSLFVIAEVDGTPAAAMCGFDANTQGAEVFTRVLPAAVQSAGLDVEYDQPLMDRIALAQRVNPDHAPGAWVIENVGCMPAFRRRGLVEKLLVQLIDRGRERGYDTCQIAVLIGNAPARNAYIKAGFEYVDELRDAELEAAFGSPGSERLLRPI